MLYPEIEKSREITRAERRDDALWLFSEHSVHRIMPLSAETVRLSCFLASRELKEHEDIAIVEKKPFGDWSFSEDGEKIVLRTEKTVIEVDRKTAAYRYFNADGKLLLKERNDESRELEPFMTYKTVPGMTRTERVKTADGEKTVIRDAAKTDAGESLHCRLNLEWQDGEALFGLGQHEEGFGSLRGRTVYVHQGNRKIALPLLVSSLGYGLLLGCGSPAVFCDNEYGHFIYIEAAPSLDFYFLNGGSMAGAVALYRKLSGKASMLPKWAFGYIQSQERFETQREILDTAAEYRRRGIGLDCIVLDWMSWENGKWGQKSFDRSRFPDPTEMVDQLHKNNVKFMISVWPSVSATAENRRDFEEAGLMIPESEFYDPFEEKGREIYWRQTSEGLFKHGIDAWWCDNCEPFTPEWEQLFRPLPGRLYEMYCSQAGLRIDIEKSNEYALYHAKGVYEGQRAENSGKRVVNLTRSGYTGHQRFGTILWSGDIEAKWETLRKQIAAGLGFCASGHPYWTVDIGAFFVRRGKIWYWKGDFPDAEKDAGYCELFTRWYQWAAFLPVFRGHGTDCRRELWNFGDGGMFYEAMLAANRLRYRLTPYIYSAAGRTWLFDESIIRFLAFDYPDDEIAKNITDQYMFGDALIVCPVTKPMYYAPKNKKLDVEKSREVYLPEGDWYRLGEREKISGKRWISVPAGIESIPVFVKAGSIIPVAEPALSTAETPRSFTLAVYPGADGSFKFYDDAGDGYGYERGEYTLAEIAWNDAERKLSVPESIRDRVEKVEIVE